MVGGALAAALRPISVEGQGKPRRWVKIWSYLPQRHLVRSIPGAVRSPVFMSMRSCVVACPISFVLGGGRFTKSLYTTLLAHESPKRKNASRADEQQSSFSRHNWRLKPFADNRDKYNKP
jgi:hypothetical protein